MLDRSYDVPTSPPSWTPGPSDDEREPESRDHSKDSAAQSKRTPSMKTNIKQSLDPKNSLRPDISRTRADKAAAKQSPRKVSRPHSPGPAAATPRVSESMARSRTPSRHGGPTTRSQSAMSRRCGSHASSCSSKGRRLRKKTKSGAAAVAASVAASVAAATADQDRVQAITSQGLIWCCLCLKILLPKIEQAPHLYVPN